jgi:hypothetical protein
MAEDTNEPIGSTESGDDADAPTDAPAGESKHGLKHDLRRGVAKVVGYTVEVASILGQQGGPAVEAERDIAEANTEGFIDRIDGDD